MKTARIKIILIAVLLVANPSLGSFISRAGLLLNPTRSGSAVAALDVARWTVSVTINELHDTTDNDAAGGYDFYFKTRLESLIGVEEPVRADNYENHSEDDYHLDSIDWGSSIDVSGNAPGVRGFIEIWDHDWPSEDDRLDIHPEPGFNRVTFVFSPATNRLDIAGIDDDGDTVVDEADGTDTRCARGRITLEGMQGVDRARIVFTVNGSAEGAVNGDSDGDGLTDADERCGVDADSNGTIDVDLPGMGADPFRRDLFVEIDWMLDSDGAAPADHSHEPWLPALINAWHELDQAPVSGPIPPDGIARRSGIALHVDVGTLYANYAVDFDGDGVNELSVDAIGNADIDPDGSNGPLLPDGIPDIGNLGALGAGTPGGGNRLCANLTAAPCAVGQLGDFTPLPAAQNGPNNDASDAMANNFVANRARVFRYVIFADFSNPGGNSGWTPWGTVDFVVSLGPFGAAPVGIVGPSGLPVMGSIGQHTGTFLHELGHSLGLGHGGGDGVNRKPNYLSVMSYDYQMPGITYDLNGDGLADPLIGFDFDNDGLPDNQRYTYSMDRPQTNGLPQLNEGALNEGAGIGDGQAIFFYGPARVDTSRPPDGICDVNCALPAVSVRTAVGNQAIDWNRDGDAVDFGVSNLANPPNPAGITTDINRDGIIQAALSGFNDYNFLQNQSLKGVSKEEDDAFVRSLERVKELTEAQFVAAAEPRSITSIKFDNLAPGALVNNQFAALGVRFRADGIRRPTIAGPNQRSGLPTSSPPGSLVNSPVAPANSGGVPLVIFFNPPVRLLSLRLGRVTQGNPAKDVAVLTAFDTRGFRMGSVQRPIPDFNQGVTAYLAMGAIFPDRLIARVELNYILNPTTNPLEPEHIDDLIICRDLVARQPAFPDAPEFGEGTVQVGVTAEVRYPVETGNELQRRHWEGAELSGVSIQWNRTNAGQAGNTEADFSLTFNEGEHLKLTAPAGHFDVQWGPLTFLYWRQGENVYFSREEVEIASRVLRNASFTAVYQVKQISSPPQNVSLRPEADAYVFSATPTTNYGTTPTLYVGSQSVNATGRALLRFDLSAIPAGATVLDASFQAYLTQTSTSPSKLDVELKQITQPWEETSVSWRTPLGYAAPYITNGEKTASGYYSWNVTSLVQTWVRGAPNRGFALVSQKEGAPVWHGFASKESDASPPHPPRLVITYRRP
jgi:hypothetical protein